MASHWARTALPHNIGALISDIARVFPHLFSVLAENGRLPQTTGGNWRKRAMLPHRAGKRPLIAKRERDMSVARITEIIASSDKSFEDATKKGIERACKTLKGVQGAWVQDQKVTVKDGKIDEYRVSLKVTFVLDD